MKRISPYELVINPTWDRLNDANHISNLNKEKLEMIKKNCNLDYIEYLYNLNVKPTLKLAGMFIYNKKTEAFHGTYKDLKELLDNGRV